MDQTGVHLVSASSWTYEMVGSKDVAVVAAEDKRQITACVAASLRGDLLPLQLIFQGKTERSLPQATAASLAARVDITHSENHWSTQRTMQRWITHVLLPHAERMIDLHQLDSNPHILLLLDAWAVHKSAEFRGWLQKEHPLIHLVYVPPNCTSKLQWCIDSWKGLQERKKLILDGWDRSCLRLFDITSEKRRRDAVELIALNKLELESLPVEAEPDGYPSEDSEEEGEDELDTSKRRVFGKQSERVRTQTKQFGFMVDPTRIEIDQEHASSAAAASPH